MTREAITFGKWLRELRKEKGWSQNKLAGDANIPKGTINSWESEKIAKITNLDALIRVVSRLSLTRDESNRFFRKASGQGIPQLKATIQSEKKYRSVQDALLKLLQEIESGSHITASSQPSQSLLSPPFNVPRPYAEFFGRQDLLDQTVKEVQKPGAVCVLSGMSGVGKSAVAQEVGYALKKRLKGWVIWLDLSNCVVDGALNEDVVRGHLDVIAESFGLEVQGGAGFKQQVDRIRRLLFDKNLLLILDNAFGFFDAQHFIPAAGAKSSVLITTQARRFPAGTAHHIEVDRLTAAEGVSFLAHLVDVDRVEREEESATALVDFVAGHTLSLMVMGRTLKAYEGIMTLEEYLQEIRDEQLLLDHLKDWQGVTPGVRATFAATLRRLDKTTQAIFASLALFDGLSFSRSAIAAMFPELSRLTFLESLHKLQERNLLGLPDDDGRYSLHGLLRLFARELAKARPDTAERQANLLSYFEEFVHQQRTAGYKVIARDWPNITPLLARLAQTDASRFNSLLTDLAWRHLGTHGFLEAQGHWREGVELLEQQRLTADSLASAESLFKRGLFVAKLGEHKLAITFFERCQTVLDQLQQDSEEVAILASHLFAQWGGLLADKGRFEEAQTLLQQAQAQIALFDSPEARIAQGVLKFRFGSTVARLGELDRARELLAQSLTLLPVADTNLRLNVLNTLGIVASMKGESDVAVEYWEEVRHIAQEKGYEDRLASSLANLSTIYSYQGDFSRSISYAELALSYHERMENQEQMGLAYNNLSYDLLESEIDLAKGEWYANKALALGREFDFPDVTAHALNNLARFNMRYGDWQQVKRGLLDALDLGKTYKILETVWESHRLWGRFLAHTASAAAAVEYLIMRLPEFDKAFEWGVGQRYLGEWLADDGRFDEAQIAFARSQKSLQSYAWELGKTMAAEKLLDGTSALS